MKLLTFVISAATAAADVSDDITAGGCADSHPLPGDLKDDAAVVVATGLVLSLFPRAGANDNEAGFRSDARLL